MTLEQSITSINFALLILFFICPLKSFAESMPVVVRGQVYSLVDPPEFDEESWEISGQIPEISEIRSGDFNGDGASDFILRDKITGRIFIAVSGKNRIFLLQTWGKLDFAQKFTSIAIGDLDGNDCDDLLVPVDNSTQWTAELSNCSDRFESRQLPIFTSKFRIMYSFAQQDIDQNCPDILACSLIDESRICYLSKCNSPFQYRESAVFEGVGIPFSIDVIGNGKKVLISHPKKLFFGDKTGPRWIIGNTYDPITNSVWATFDSNYDWGNGVVGDFNGDGLDDIFVSSDSLLGSWLGVSTTRTAIEIPVKGGPILLDESELYPESAKINYSVGDFNADGIDDIATIKKRAKIFRIFSWKKSGSYANVAIIIDQKNKLLTGQTGTYSTLVQMGETFQVSAQKDALSFTNSTRKIKLQKTSPRTINFVADLQNKDGIVGRAVQLAGDAPGPYVCLGYNYSRDNYSSKWGYTVNSECPDNYAIFSTYSPRSIAKTPDRVGVGGTCCRLPSADILTDEHFFTYDECPEDSVVTANTPDQNHEQTDLKMRCTKINTKRYALAKSSPGVVFGVSAAMRHWKNRIDRGSIPLAIRYGIHRWGYNKWMNHGCIGQPWGSLMVAKGPGSCSGLSFSQLVYRGINGDPPAGVAVKMFPDCRMIENIYDPRSGCRP